MTLKGTDEAQLPHRKSSLDMADGPMRELSEQFTALVIEYFAGVSQLPVFPQTTGAEIEAQFDAVAPGEAEPLEQIISDCRKVIEGCRHNGHPRFFGYVASPSNPAGAFADLLASTINPSVTSWRSAPAATVIERTVVRWLGSLIGYDDNAHGILTSGGSMANFTALLIAHRAKCSGNASQQGLWNAGPPMTLYASDQVHLSIPKAADLLGLGRDQVRLLPADDDFRLDLRAVRDCIEGDKQRGLRPFCLVGSAGTAASGAIDPLAEMARIAREQGLWFHIDGAYGAPAAMVPDKRPSFMGLELADSISLDPHKWLYTPVDCGCLLSHDPTAARRAFVVGADYIKVHEEADTESFAFWDYGVELSRRFRALKVWLTLKYYGARRITEAIADDIALAEHMAERVRAADDFDLLAPTELSICCFRYVSANARRQLETATDQAERDRVNSELNRLNERIMLAVQRGGRAYLSNATLRGKFALRACIINFRTSRADIDLTLDVVRETAREIAAANERGSEQIRI
jgi:glutamate/tyrosine decarboxylase-like PLP-dependent enzyme